PLLAPSEETSCVAAGGRRLDEQLPELLGRRQDLAVGLPLARVRARGGLSRRHAGGRHLRLLLALAASAAVTSDRENEQRNGCSQNDSRPGTHEHHLLAVRARRGELKGGPGAGRTSARAARKVPPAVSCGSGRKDT